MRKKTVITGLALAAAGSLAVSLLAPAPTPQALNGVEPQAHIVHTASKPLFESLPTRQQMGPTRGELFSSKEPLKQKPAAPVVAPPAPPSPPPMPYRVAGHFLHDGKAQVVLAKGDRLFTVQEGDTLDSAYEVRSINPGAVTLVYTPLGAAHHLPFGSLLSAQPPSLPVARAPAQAEPSPVNGGPPQLRWQGPERVYAGSPFEVVLKLSSAQRVRSSPLELSYDPKLLEPLAVRPGGFFAEGKLAYRVMRGGSIAVGAPRSEFPAADIDFLIVTFKPIRAGATAELKLSSIELTDVAGVTVTHAPAPVFRTAILQ